MTDSQCACTNAPVSAVLELIAARGHDVSVEIELGLGRAGTEDFLIAAMPRLLEVLLEGAVALKWSASTFMNHRDDDLFEDLAVKLRRVFGAVSCGDGLSKATCVLHYDVEHLFEVGREVDRTEGEHIQKSFDQPNVTITISKELKLSL